MRVRLIVAMCTVALSGHLAFAAECQPAIDSYNSAIGDISSTMKRYGSCLSASNGSDDCSSEFRRLRSAQNDFESAVASMPAECH